MIRLARESTGRSSWLPWRQAQDLSEAGKLNRALLEVDGPALPRVGWWIAGALMVWVVMENLL